jgi:hypothetical protein
VACLYEQATLVRCRNDLVLTLFSIHPGSPRGSGSPAIALGGLHDGPGIRSTWHT